MGIETDVAAAQKELARQKRRAAVVTAMMITLGIAGIALQLIAPGLSYRRGLHPNYSDPGVETALIAGKAVWALALLGFWPLARIAPRIGRARQRLDGARLRQHAEQKGKLLH